MDAQTADRGESDKAGDNDDQRQRQLAVKQWQGEAREENSSDQRQRQKKAGEPMVTAGGRDSAFGRRAPQGVGMRVQGTLQSKWIDIGTAVFSIERPSRASVPLPLSCPDPTTELADDHHGRSHPRSRAYTAPRRG